MHTAAVAAGTPPPRRRHGRARLGPVAFTAALALGAMGYAPHGATGGKRSGGATAPPATASPTRVAAPPTTVAAPSPPTSVRPGPPPDAGRPARVGRVVDGDTFELAGGEKVRLVGIDTPETVDPRRPVGCFGAASASRLRQLIPPGTEVRLVHDVERTDRCGRTLAYVYRDSDGLFVNGAMVRDGYAAVATYPPNVAHAPELLAFQRQAREAGRGLWSACEGVGEPATTPTWPPSGGDAGGRSCDGAYPDVCIPPPAPDLDCGDIPHRRFRVLPPDPHRFDAEGDGIGCESG